MSLFCIRGCVRRGRHLAECEGDPCTGCEPRGAQDGLLCWPCFANLERALRQSAWLVGHIRENVEPGSSNGDSGRSNGDGRRAPLRLDAVDDADQIHATLSSWALLHIEEHPGSAVGPSKAGSRVTGSGVVGLKPEAGTEPTKALASWLIDRLGWACEQPWVDEYVREVTGMSTGLLARWPDAERSRPVREVRCRKCERRSIVYYPPTHAGGKVQLRCDHQECGAEVDENEWPWFARVIAEEHRVNLLQAQKDAKKAAARRSA